MRDFLIESHPEFCFAELLGHPCEHPKRKQQGENERVAVLKGHMDIAHLLYATPSGVARDDVIDAAVLALSGLTIGLPTKE